eukprot:m.129620 g.129620  ORF g.129620 m.129620 type:complete len:371 (-) comp29412_c0_seq1:71-1183(-)
MTPHWIGLLITMLVDISWCVPVNSSATLSPIDTHEFTFAIQNGEANSGLLIDKKVSIHSTIPIPDQFFGWLYSTAHCDMSDVPKQTTTTFGIVVVTEQHVERCGPTAVVNHVLAKCLHGVVELSKNESGIQTQLWMQGTPWITLFAPVSTTIENSMIRNWTWFDLRAARIRTTARIESTSLASVTSTISVSTSTTTTLEPIVTITSKPQDPGDIKANASAALILYIAVGIVCGGLTGLLILCIGRHLHTQHEHRQHSQQHQINQTQSHYEDEVAVLQSRDEMERLLRSWPVGPYPTKLVKVFCEEDDGTKPCAVCFEDMQGSPRCRVLPCCHVFHAECIDPWLRQRPTCPICVSNVVHHRPPMTAWTLVE